MKIGLFFGSFNPVHVGHLIIADHMAHHTDLEEVWMVVTPHNPHKKQASLAKDYDRLHLVHLALQDYDKIKVSNIEFGLPKPSYTIDTLTYLREKHPQHDFSLIMGGDNLTTLHKWKNAEVLMRDYDFYIYRREGSETDRYNEENNIHFADAPIIELSSTHIRKAIKSDKDYRFMLSESVFNYIRDANLYQ